MSLRDRIIAVDDTQKEIVTITEWGVEVEIRGMSGAARASISQDAAENNGNINFLKMMPERVVQWCFDPITGEQVFDASDKELVMGKSGAALDRIVSIAMRLSGFGDKAVDEAGKDSSSTPKGGSSTI